MQYIRVANYKHINIMNSNVKFNNIKCDMLSTLKRLQNLYWRMKIRRYTRLIEKVGSWYKSTYFNYLLSV